MSSLVDSTLEDILKLKSKYVKEFSEYETSFSEYKEVVNMINRIENAVIDNKIKIENIKQRMKENEKQNNSKLIMVKKLNDVENN